MLSLVVPKVTARVWKVKDKRPYYPETGSSIFLQCCRKFLPGHKTSRYRWKSLLFCFDFETAGLNPTLDYSTKSVYWAKSDTDSPVGSIYFNAWRTVMFTCSFLIWMSLGCHSQLWRTAPFPFILHRVLNSPPPGLFKHVLLIFRHGGFLSCLFNDMR
jgi:hypothetical protein